MATIGTTLRVRTTEHPMRAIFAIAALAAVHAGSAYACVEPELQGGSIVYPELGPECPASDAYKRPSREQRIEQERQAAVADVQRRTVQQGNKVHRVSDDACENLLLRVPQPATSDLAPPWVTGQPSPYNQYLTPQENWCMALGRSHESPANNQFPGMLPDGWHAVPLGNGSWQINHN
jgi:hypothetical protein